MEHLDSLVPIKDQKYSKDSIPLVGVRVMTFMHENFIIDCLEGIINQKTDFIVKVYLHDDCSTDRTVEIIKEYEEKYPDLIIPFFQKINTYTHPKKSELRKPFRQLIQGKYLAICEGDDYWTDPIKLKKQVSFLEENPEYSACSHQRIIVDQNNNILSEEKYFDKVFTQCLVYRKDILSDFYKYIGPKTRGVSDFALFAYLEYKGKIKIFDFVGAAYRKSPSGFWSLKSEDFRYHKRKPTYDALEAYFRNNNARQQLKKLYKAKSRTTYQYIVFLVKEGSFFKAILLFPQLLKFRIYSC
jgi:glycosyltransferase involved in cell wall biosynthesis